MTPGGHAHVTNARGLCSPGQRENAGSPRSEIKGFLCASVGAVRARRPSLISESISYSCCLGVAQSAPLLPFSPPPWPGDPAGLPPPFPSSHPRAAGAAFLGSPIAALTPKQGPLWSGWCLWTTTSSSINVLEMHLLGVGFSWVAEMLGKEPASHIGGPGAFAPAPPAAIRKSRLLLSNHGSSNTDAPAVSLSTSLPGSYSHHHLFLRST